MVASPSLTLTITPPGGSPATYQQYLTYSGHNNQMTVDQNFGRQGDTAVLTLVDEYSSTPHFHIPVMSQVSLYDHNCSQTLFAGVVNDPILTVTGPNRNEWTLNCTDYTFYADNAIVHGVFNGLTTDQVVVLLTNQANCGISAATIADGGFVAPGPTMANLILNYGSLSDAWRKLATLAGASTPYGWYVDQNLALHFYDATTAISSGVTFTTTPTVGGSITQGHMLLDSTNAYEWNGGTLHNRVLVQGANQTVAQPSSGSPTDTWLANGAQQAWPLRYTVSGTPTLTVGGVSQTVTSVTPGTVAPASGWSCQQNAFGQYFLYNPTAPAAGNVIECWYSYSVPVVAQATDYESIVEYTGPNGGVFAEFISDTTLTTVPMALNRAQQERTEYAFAAEQATFNTSEDFLGWVRAGETCGYVNQFVYDYENSRWGVNDTFLVVANTVTFATGGYRQQQITAVRL